jgi:hypothetical protein
MSTPAATDADLRYPVGKYHHDGPATAEQHARWIEEIAATPGRLRAAVSGLTDAQLNTPYRPGGWTVRQVVHHVPESHMNAYVRFKLALTEDEPTIKPYAEARWAELPDVAATPIDVSLALLDALHDRWVRLLRALGPNDLARTFRHPELGRTLTLEWTLGQYAWHGRHHVAHITALRARSGWR